MTTKEKIRTAVISVLLAIGFFGVWHLAAYLEYQKMNNYKEYGFSRADDTTRDYAYEAYCDSIYEHDTMYYIDVLTETPEYQDYLEKHGVWWSEEYSE